MRLILGLGNPGTRYKYNRHNAGFMFLDFLADSLSLSFTASKFDFYCAEGELGQSDFAFIKPAGYMNNSGIAASQAVAHYNTDISELLVVVDDVNLNLATYRLRASGGDGGHNGIKSIIYHLSSNQFPRLRIGVGNEFSPGQMADYVLENFNNTELQLVNSVFTTCESLIKEYITGGFNAMLNLNSRMPGINNNDFINPDE